MKVHRTIKFRYVNSIDILTKQTVNFHYYYNKRQMTKREKQNCLQIVFPTPQVYRSSANGPMVMPATNSKLQVTSLPRSLGHLEKGCTGRCTNSTEMLKTREKLNDTCNWEILEITSCIMQNCQDFITVMLKLEGYEHVTAMSRVKGSGSGVGLVELVQWPW